MSLSPRDKLRARLPVRIAVIGDSTSCGFGANGDDNWNQSSPYAIPLSGYVSQAVIDNINIPSACRLLHSWLLHLNPNSTFQNLGASGWRANDHVANNTASMVNADLTIIALGINSAKNNQYQGAPLRTLISQLSGEVVISLGHNVALLNTTTPMPHWLNMRAEMKAIAEELGLDVIDAGSDDNAINPAFTHDGFHPSALGYQDIFKAYMKYLYGEAQLGKQRFNINKDGALRINTSRGVIGLSLTESKKPTAIKTSQGYFSIEGTA